MASGSLPRCRRTTKAVFHVQGPAEALAVCQFTPQGIALAKTLYARYRRRASREPENNGPLTWPEGNSWMVVSCLSDWAGAETFSSTAEPIRLDFPHVWPEEERGYGQRGTRSTDGQDFHHSPIPVWRIPWFIFCAVLLPLRIAMT